ncbi:helix-turn-helix domain-containing protein [Roseibium sp. TrichSKD4]|uniref:helix-turn-helix domain-containing protein n=1 Tax=Roseibium sp. TrichSKD4 TaxID=744980 RepID=UPI0006814FAA|nr:helix-turn-helix domain-containing protein [Roseibium sp. TrichSKD4]
MDKNDRLRKARKDAGFASATAAAESLGVNLSTYISHENGNRDFNEEIAAKYARRFSVDVTWLIFGTRPTKDSTFTAQLLESGIEDEELFMEAYREAKELEEEYLGGPGPRIKFSKMHWMIYAEKLANKKGSS